MWKIIIGMSIFAFSQSSFAIVEIYQNNNFYKVNSNQSIEYNVDSKEIFIINNGVKKNLGLTADHGFYVSKINGQLNIIIDKSGNYPTTPYFYYINKNGKLIESKYDYKEIPENFSYHDGFECKYSEKNNVEINFTCSNQDISKNTKYNYTYKNGSINLIKLNDDKVGLKVCNQTYNSYVDDWKITKKNNISWSGENLPLAITRGLSNRVKITENQYAQLLNNKNLLSRSMFQQKVCIK